MYESLKRQVINNKREKVDEATKQETRIARIISRYSNRLAKNFVNADSEARLGISTALSILNQAQMLAIIDPNEARKLLASARLVANIRDDDEQ